MSTRLASQYRGGLMQNLRPRQVTALPRTRFFGHLPHRRTIITPPLFPIHKGPMRTAAPNMAPNRTSRPAVTRLIVVYGYGCDTRYGELEQRHAQLRQNRNRSKVTHVDVMCNTQEPKSMTYDIWKRLVRGKKLLEPTKFVVRVMDAVCQALQRGENVILAGHSYGGSVVARVAMFLGTELGGICTPQTFNRRLLSKLRVVTFGSIFIPPPEKTHGIKIEHYVYANDIAGLCHKQSRRCEFVKMMRARPGLGPIQSHTNYDHLITSIAQTGSINNVARKAHLMSV